MSVGFFVCQDIECLLTYFYANDIVCLSASFLLYASDIECLLAYFLCQGHRTSVSLFVML